MRRASQPCSRARSVPGFALPALCAQAAVAQQAGFGELAQNLLRAAELMAVPNEQLLEMYDALRPGRSTAEELTAMADTLRQEFGATQTAAYVEEALGVYTQRGLLKK